MLARCFALAIGGERRCVFFSVQAAALARWLSSSLVVSSNSDKGCSLNNHKAALLSCSHDTHLHTTNLLSYSLLLPIVHV